MGCRMDTLQEANIYPTERGKEHHLPNHLGRGHVSSQDGHGWYMLMDQFTERKQWSLMDVIPMIFKTSYISGLPRDNDGVGSSITPFCHNRVVGNQWMPVIALHPMILWNWCSRYRTLVLWKAVICDHRSGDDTSCHSFHYKFRISRFVICSENFISIRVIWCTHIPFTTSCYDIFLLKDLHLWLPGNLICFIVDASKVTAPSGSPSSLHVKVRKFTWAALQ